MKSSFAALLLPAIGGIAGAGVSQLIVRRDDEAHLYAQGNNSGKEICKALIAVLKCKGRK